MYWAILTVVFSRVNTASTGLYLLSYFQGLILRVLRTLEYTGTAPVYWQYTQYQVYFCDLCTAVTLVPTLQVKPCGATVGLSVLVMELIDK